MSIKKGPTKCPSKRANEMSLQKGKSNVPSKRASQVSLKKGKSSVPQKGQIKCPSKRASQVSLKKGKSNDPQEGLVKCPSKQLCICASESSWVGYTWYMEEQKWLGIHNLRCLYVKDPPLSSQCLKCQLVLWLETSNFLSGQTTFWQFFIVSNYTISQSITRTSKFFRQISNIGYTVQCGSQFVVVMLLYVISVSELVASVCLCTLFWYSLDCSYWCLLYNNIIDMRLLDLKQSPYKQCADCTQITDCPSQHPS